MVRFHEDMINALTWLTSAESKVAELDSAVEATSTEEQQDMEALRKELKVSFVSSVEYGVYIRKRCALGYFHQSPRQSTAKGDESYNSSRARHFVGTP